MTRRLVGGLIRGYQLVLSPWVTQQCRYYPSCSAYALEAVRVHGVLRGLAMAGWRFLRCNPFTPGGVDYVPGSPDAVSYAARAAEAQTPSHTEHQTQPQTEPQTETLPEPGDADLGTTTPDAATPDASEPDASEPDASAPDLLKPAPLGTRTQPAPTTSRI